MSDETRAELTFNPGPCTLPMLVGGVPGQKVGICGKLSYGMPAMICDSPGPQYRMCPEHGGPKLLDAIAGRVVIRFDGPPAHESGRFIEVERDGAGIKFGEWVQDGEYWLLVLPPDPGRREETATMPNYEMDREMREAREARGAEERAEGRIRRLTEAIALACERLRNGIDGCGRDLAERKIILDLTAAMRIGPSEGSCGQAARPATREADDPAIQRAVARGRAIECENGWRRTRVASYHADQDGKDEAAMALRTLGRDFSKEAEHWRMKSEVYPERDQATEPPIIGGNLTGTQDNPPKVERITAMPSPTDWDRMRATSVHLEQAVHRVECITKAAIEARDWIKNPLIDLVPFVDRPATEARIDELNEALAL